MTIVSPSIGWNGYMLMFAKRSQMSHNIHYAKLILSKKMDNKVSFKEELEKIPCIEADRLLAMANEYRQSYLEHAKHFGHEVHKGYPYAYIAEFQMLLDESNEFYSILNFLRANDLCTQEDVDQCHQNFTSLYMSMFVEGILEEERGETEND